MNLLGDYHCKKCPKCGKRCGAFSHYRFVTFLCECRYYFTVDTA